MAQAKIASGKIRKVTLVITAVIVVVALLFVLRAYINEKFGIFASTEANEEIAFNVDFGNIKLYSNLLNNVIRNNNKRIVLRDTSKAGWLQGQIINTNHDKLTSVKVNATVPSSCGESNVKLSIQLCTDSAGQLTCGDWLQSNSTTPRTVRPPIPVIPDSLWYRVDLTPCTVAGSATATASPTTVASPELYSIDVYRYIAGGSATVSEPPVPPLPSLSAASTASAPPVPPSPSRTTTVAAIKTKTATATASLTAAAAAATPTPTVISAGEFIVSGIQSGVSFALTIIIVVLIGAVIIFRIMTAKD